MGEIEGLKALDKDAIELIPVVGRMLKDLTPDLSQVDLGSFPNAERLVEHYLAGLTGESVVIIPGLSEEESKKYLGGAYLAGAVTVEAAHHPK